MIALAILMLAACDSAGAASVEHEWLAHEHEAAPLERFLAPDFVHVLGSGQFITKADHIGYAAAHPAPAGFEAHFERLDIRLVSGVAIATGRAVSAQETVIASTSR